MARQFTPQDACELITLTLKQATGQEPAQEINSSNFVSVGEQILATGLENTLNALSMVLGRPLVASRKYDGKMQLVQARNTGEYTSRFRKISYYAKTPKEAGDWNTNINTNLKTGFDNGSNSGQGTASMWEQNAPMPLEINFGGRSVWQDSLTRYKYQVQQAFRSEEDFVAFVNGFITEKQNDIESQKEAFNRMLILNMIGAIYDCGDSMKGSKVNLTKAYNDKFGTSYTSEELRTTHLKSFLEFFTSEFKLHSDYMTNRTKNYHWSVDKEVDGESYSILRHTPKADQRALLYAPLFVESEAMVFPEIFHEDYLFNADQHELVTYWQSVDSRSEVNITPAIPDIAHGGQTQIEGEVVNIPYVVGLLYDRDAMLIDYQLDDAEVTPLEARKRYYNIWYSFSKNAINDITENAILFYMEDEDITPNVSVDAVSGTTTLFDHQVSTFQRDVSVSGKRVLGKLKFIEGGLASSGPLAGDGYFLALQFSATNWDAYTDVKVGLSPSAGTGLVSIINDPDKNGVFKITDTKKQKFIIETTDTSGRKERQTYSLVKLQLVEDF